MSNQTPTPETDAFILSAPANFITRTMWTDHARRLERERDTLQREINEALMLAEHPEISTLKQLPQELAYRGQRILELRRERDEARAMVLHERNKHEIAGAEVARLKDWQSIKVTKNGETYPLGTLGDSDAADSLRRALATVRGEKEETK
jgi:hypothetical protein